MFCRSRRLLRSGKGPPAPDRHKNLIALVGEGRHWQRRRSCATCKGLGLCKMSTRSPSSKGGAQIPCHLGPLLSSTACTQYFRSQHHSNDCRVPGHCSARPRRRLRPRQPVRATPVLLFNPRLRMKECPHSSGCSLCMLSRPRQLQSGSGLNRITIASSRTDWQHTRSVVICPWQPTPVHTYQPAWLGVHTYGM